MNWVNSSKLVLAVDDLKADSRCGNAGKLRQLDGSSRRKYKAAKVEYEVLGRIL